MTGAGKAARRGLALAALAAGMMAPAHGQQVVTAPVAATGLGDVAVTAQRRLESAQSVPIAASVFAADTLDVLGVRSTGQVGAFVPNMVSAGAPGLGSGNLNYIRGIGSNAALAGVDAPVGSFVDDIHLPGQAANEFNFFDLDRVEVLRGPQGTLLGRNTSGGAINVVLKRPGTELAGFGELSYGSFHRWTGRGSIDLPLSSGVGLKLSGYIADDHGYVKNTTTGERLNNRNGAGLRAALRIDLAPGLQWNGSVAYMRADGDNLLDFACDPVNPADCKGRFATTGLKTTGNSFAPLAIAGRKSEFGLGNRTNTVLSVSNFEWAGEAATLNVITGFVDRKQKFAMDFADGRALPTVAGLQPAVAGFALGGFTRLDDSVQKSFSQEVKLSGHLFGGVFDYVVGGLVTDETVSSDAAAILTDFAGATPVPRLLGDRRLDTAVKSIAGYAQGDLRLGEGLKLTAGVRYTDERRRLSILDNRSGCGAACLDAGNLVAANGAAIPTRLQTRQWTPRAAINYKPNADLLLFASATRGYGSGGWNLDAFAPARLLPYRPSTLWSYEAGVKSDWFDHRLRANLTAFWLDARQVQVNSTTVAAGGVPASDMGNAGDMRNRGVELELVAVPMAGLNLFATLGYQDARYRVDGAAPAADAFGTASVAAQQAQCLAQLAGGLPALACGAGIVTATGAIAAPVRAPKFSLAAGGSYDFPIPAAGIILTPSANVSYRSKYETDAANLVATTRAHALVNAGLTMRTDDDNWTLAVECNNCLDITYVESSLFNASYLNLPRTWQVRAKRVF